MTVEYITAGSNLVFDGRDGTTDRNVIKDVLLSNNYGIKNEYLYGSRCVIDIGANIGAFTCFACSINPDVRVAAYEPERDNLHLLKSNIARNGFANRVMIHEKAVSDKAGEIEIVARHGNSRLVSAAGGANPAEGQKYAVPVVGLADVFTDNGISRCDFLKVDAEWSEYQIFECESEVLGRCSRIALEFHPCDTGEAFAKIICKLTLTHQVRILGSHKLGGYIWAHM